MDLQSVAMAGNQYTFLAPGFAKWWGSDGRALAQAFRRLGHCVLDIDEEDFVPWRWHSKRAKVLRRLFDRVWIDDYNLTVLRLAQSAAYDFVLVFKGNFLKPATLRRLGESGKPVFNFYPDVSFADHGSNIAESLRLYDCVFSTKSYHGEQEVKQFGIRELKHVRHGYDPEVHRPVKLTAELAHNYECDVSFVGCWSPEKESKILHLLQQAGELSVRIYGGGWDYASSQFKQTIGQGLRPGAFGDELAIVYKASKVNLGLLSCSVSDQTLCDQSTARTFQIPATRSYMLHQDTPEVRSFFREETEVQFFADNETMVQKVRLAVKDDDLRMRISRQAYERCLAEPYDYSSAAKDILKYFEERTSAEAK
jgi:glycosyltransferase involved in cell wall biosynthesis